MLRRIFYDVKRGRENEFPSCCIMFYSLLWGRLSDVSQISPKTLQVWTKLIGDPYHHFINSDEISWHRIPCPKCVIHDKLGMII